MAEPEPEPIPAPTPVAPTPVIAAAAPLAAPVMPVVAAAPAAPVAAAPAASSAHYGDVPTPVKRKSSGAMIGIILGLLVAIGGAAFVLTRPKNNAPAATTTTPATSSAASTAPATNVASASTTSTAPLTATTSIAPSIDPNAVDAEVQKRIAAERARLEALQRTQQTPATATTAPARPTAAPVQTASATPPPVTAPVQQPETRPEPTPARTESQPAVAETRPEPARPQPAVQRAREGDLVAAGTEGLTPPRLVRRGTVNYPAIARTQRVQGTVITSVLVSETGAVLDVRILRGIGRPVGLDEAAEQAMRRSTFSPGTKDGVRVRSWLTVPVEFKL